MKTSTDAGKITGLHRRKIQEYEKAGIAIKPSTRNKYGYGIYTEEIVNRLWQIRFYEEVGYKKADMRRVFDAPDYSFVGSLDEQIDLLEKKKAEIDNLIGVARLMKEEFLTPGMLQTPVFGLEKISYEESVGFWGALSRAIDGVIVEDGSMTDEDADLIVRRLDSLIKLHSSGASSDEPTAQAAVKELHEAVKPWLSESYASVFAISAFIAPGSEAAGEIDAEYGVGAAEFLYGAIQEYASKGIETGPDKVILDALEAIIDFGKKRFKPSSAEVQHEVEKISSFYDALPGMSARGVLPELAKLYSDPSYYQVFDDQVRTKGAGKYIGKALVVYCDRSPSFDK